MWFKNIRELFRGIIYVVLWLGEQGGNPWLSELVLMCMEEFYLFTSSFSLLAPDKVTQPLFSGCGPFQAWCWGFWVTWRNPTCLLCPQMKAWSQTAHFCQLDSPTGWGISRGTTTVAPWTLHGGMVVGGRGKRAHFIQLERAPARARRLCKKLAAWCDWHRPETWPWRLIWASLPFIPFSPAGKALEMVRFAKAMESKTAESNSAIQVGLYCAHPRETCGGIFTLRCAKVENR